MLCFLSVYTCRCLQLWDKAQAGVRNAAGNPSNVVQLHRHALPVWLYIAQRQCSGCAAAVHPHTRVAKPLLYTIHVGLVICEKTTAFSTTVMNTTNAHGSHLTMCQMPCLACILAKNSACHNMLFSQHE